MPINKPKSVPDRPFSNMEIKLPEGPMKASKEESEAAFELVRSTHHLAEPGEDRHTVLMLDGRELTFVELQEEYDKYYAR